MSESRLSKVPVRGSSLPARPIPTGILTIYVGGFRITRRGRFWAVKDPEGVLVCVAVYKKGALEVVRRLLPPEDRDLTTTA